MKYIPQFFIILAIGAASELLNAVIPAPVPACIYGIIILFFLLFSGILKLDNVKDTAKFLVEVQPLMFIPAGVSLLLVWDEVKDSVIKFILVCVLSTIATMAIAGIVTQFVIRKTDSRKIKENGSK